MQCDGLAYEHQPGRSPTLVFLPGYHSDMQGEKARHLAAFSAQRGQACLRLDYSGHGASQGVFEEGTLGRWAGDARRVIEAVTAGPLVLAGSSMGGWIALLLARALGARVTGLLGIAAAPDFTETLIRPNLTPVQREALARDGLFRTPSGYGGELVVTRAFIEEGADHLLLGGPIPIACRVHLLQGQRDPEVPWRTALRIAELVAAEDVRVTLIKDGDHRLSRPADLALLTEAAARLLGEDGG